MQGSIGRRAFLSFSAASLLRAQTGKGSTVTFAPQQFLDAATEFDLFRLTDPRFTAHLPSSDLRFITRRGRFLLYSTDRLGSMQLFRLDWKNGESRQLTAAAALDHETPALSADDRFAFFFDGPTLKQIALSNLRERQVAEVSDGWQRAPGFSLNSESSLAAWVETQAGGRSRLRVCSVGHGENVTALERAEKIESLRLRPKHNEVAYLQGGKLRLCGTDGSRDREIATDPDSTIGQALWAPGGQTLLYLSIPAERNKLITLREYSPEDATDKLVAKTSQFASFGVNGDASVFVGASRSLASPYVLLLLRVARRELTLCEHRSSNAANVRPVFSPDSQNIFFASDRKGKLAIYRAHVEKFVEQTEEEAPSSG